MKFALIDNVKTSAIKGAKGICPNCDSELIAKCGDLKVNHWAHKGIRNCDPWWENETEWHRAWKGNFPTEWQEFILKNEATGEKHIADVRSADGVIVEFQHSHINPLERTARESFYKKMVWVVDGTRLKRDYPRFLKAKENFRVTKQKGTYIVDTVNDCFPVNWTGGLVPVIFDFKGVESIKDPRDWRNYLYFLHPKSNMSVSVVTIVTRQTFIQSIITGELFNVKQEPEKYIPQKPSNKIRVQNRDSQYFYEHGRWVKRRRL